MKNINILNDELIAILRDPAVIKDYCTYYRGLVEWIKTNSRFFTQDILSNNRFDILINLNPKEYIIDNPDIVLSMEADRFEKNKPNSISTLAMIIGDKLWSLVTISSGKECPNCKYNELYYIIARTENNQKLVLECESCGWCEHLDGSKWNEKTSDGIPANKEDLKEYGIKL